MQSYEQKRSISSYNQNMGSVSINSYLPKVEALDSRNDGSMRERLPMVDSLKTMST